MRLAEKSGLLRGELGISYLLIFVGLVDIETSRNYGCVVMQLYGLSGWKGEVLTMFFVLRNYLS